MNVKTLEGNMDDKKIIDKDTVFIIGSGNSLNKIDMSKLANCNTISMNRQYIAYSDWGFIPTYYLMIDAHLINTFHKDIEKLIKNEKEIKKFFIMRHGHNSMSGWIDKMRAEENEKIVRLNVGGSEKFTKSSSDIDNKAMGFDGNAGACSVEIARLLGYKKVILLGVDAKYINKEESIKEKKDLNHFRPDYFDVNFKEGETQGPYGVNAGTKYWKIFSELQKDMDDFEIISSSPGSPINEFLEYVEFDNLFEDK